jgi:hypothetical protein
MSSVLQLALKHLDELSHGTPPRDCPMGHAPHRDSGPPGPAGTTGTLGTPEQRNNHDLGYFFPARRVSPSSRLPLKVCSILCSVCGQPARFGYGVRLLRGEEGRWFCAAHRPEAGRA